MRMRRTLLGALFLGSIILTVIACSEPQTKELLVRPVKVEKLTLTENAYSKLVIPASINECRETKLSFRVGGPLLMLNDVVGTYVKAGEVIAKIDQRDFKIAIEATESRYELAKAEYDRYKKLAEQGSVSKSVFDQMETNYKLAKANYESATNALEDTDLKAPFGGYINGSYANNYEEVIPGKPIISLLDISKFEVKGWVPVKDASLINKETEFTCIVNKGNNELRIAGNLKEIGNKTSISKQALPITIVINSSKGIDLHPGMATYLEIANKYSENGSSIQVQLASVFTIGQQTKVWIFDEKTSTVTAQLVSTGKLLDNGLVEITKGLTGNESIVSAGVNCLFEGQKVKRMEAFSTSNVGNKL